MPVNSQKALQPRAYAPAPTSPTPPAGPDQSDASGFVQYLSRGVVSAYVGGAAVSAVLALAAHHRGKKVMHMTTGRWWALAFGLAVVGAALAVLHGIGRQRRKLGIFRSVVGADGRFSTSLAQLGLWTVVAGSAFAYLLGRVQFDGGDLSTVLPGARWDEYLLLLGGPFASAVLAKGITSYKLDNGTLQKSEAETPTVRQVLTNDADSADLVDAQYLLFNVIAIGYFLVRLAAKSELPEMPGPLLAMTSSTAALYVANKAAARNAPTITAITPMTAAPGDSVTIYGTNFDPTEPSNTERLITVALSGATTTIYPVRSSDTYVTFDVPTAAAAGRQTVTVTSSAGVQAPPRELEIRSDEPRVTGIASGPLRPGARASLTGEHLGSKGEAVRVVVGTIPVRATASADGTTLSFDVPSPLPDMAAQTIDLKVEVPGRTAVTVAMPVDQPRIRSAWRTAPGRLAVAGDGWRDPERTDGREPIVLVNGAPAALAPSWRNDPDAPLAVTIPSGVKGAGELRVVIVDDLGRRSADALVAAQPTPPTRKSPARKAPGRA